MTDETTGFIEPVAMENDPGELFAGDRGVLDHDVRRVLVRLLQRRFLLKERSRDDWKVLLDNQQVIESRLGDLFVRLEVDHERGVAYKSQVRSDELEVPILLRDDAYTRAETLVLVHLRTIFQRESTAGEQSARVDVEEIEQTVLTYFAESRRRHRPPAEGHPRRAGATAQRGHRRGGVRGPLPDQPAGRDRAQRGTAPRTGRLAARQRRRARQADGPPRTRRRRTRQRRRVRVRPGRGPRTPDDEAVTRSRTTTRPRPETQPALDDDEGATP